VSRVLNVYAWALRLIGLTVSFLSLAYDARWSVLYRLAAAGEAGDGGVDQRGT
jgi:hypothetical protein